MTEGETDTNGGGNDDEKPSKLPCKWCGEKHDPRGLGPHEDNCSERPGDPGGSAAESPNEEEDIVACPTCGNHDNGKGDKIVVSDGNAESALIDNGPFGEDKRGIIRQHDYICMGCATAFGEDEGQS